VIKSQVLKAPKGQRTLGEEGPQAVAKTAKLYSKAKFTAKGVCILLKKYTNALKKGRKVAVGFTLLLLQEGCPLKDGTVAALPISSRPPLL
jgi:hypothetical protein